MTSKPRAHRKHRVLCLIVVAACLELGVGCSTDPVPDAVSQADDDASGGHAVGGTATAGGADTGGADTGGADTGGADTGGGEAGSGAAGNGGTGGGGGVGGAGTLRLRWTGEFDSNFFDERNWESEDGQRIEGEPLEPGRPIRSHLSMERADLRLAASLSFSGTEAGLSLKGASLHATSIAGGRIKLDQASTLTLSAPQPLIDSFHLDLSDGRSWVRLLTFGTRPLPLSRIQMQGKAAVLGENLRTHNYYTRGVLLRPNAPELPVLRLYSEPNLKGASAGLREAVTYSDRREPLPSRLATTASSLYLERGYQAVIAKNADGTGPARTFLAIEKPIIVNRLEAALEDSVGFVRILPWEWVTKKGTGGNVSGVRAGWYYQWGNTGLPDSARAYTPMIWGAGQLSPHDSTTIGRIRTRRDISTLLGFNEPDDCEAQSGRWHGLCEPGVAAAYFAQLQATGLRIGSPVAREGGERTWLAEFAAAARPRGARFDFVAMHWYDWNDDPSKSPLADPDKVFARFKLAIERAHEKYQLPLWVTEFNANPWRQPPVQAAFLRLALPYLESNPNVERYAFFEPAERDGIRKTRYFDPDGRLSEVGRVYQEHLSTPARPEPSYVGRNSLD
jgi:hypothetical protein